MGPLIPCLDFDTCWPLGGQHDSRAIFDPHTCTHVKALVRLESGIGRATNVWQTRYWMGHAGSAKNLDWTLPHWIRYCLVDLIFGGLCVFLHYVAILFATVTIHLTRMHSSRMRTARSYPVVSDGRGVCPTPLDADPPPWTEWLTDRSKNITFANFGCGR